MKRKNAIQNSLIYRYRYPLVGLILTVLAVFMAVYRFWDLPAGLTVAEMTAASRSGNLEPMQLLAHPTVHAANIVNLPWSLLQLASIKLFGLNVMAIRLPAVILGLTMAGTMIWLLRKLTRPNLAMMGGVVLVSSAFAISLSRSGTPAVMTVWLIALLLLLGYYAINSTSSRGQWASQLGLALAAGCLCYMVGGMYVVLAALAVALLHPRTRLQLLANRRRSLVAGGLLVLAILPLLVTIIAELTVGQHRALAGLLAVGAPSLAKAGQLGLAYVGIKSGLLAGQITPLTTIVSCIMVVIGLVTLLRQSSTSVRSYVLVGVVVMSIILGACNPSLVYLLFVPSIVLITCCLGYLTSKWYGLFPANPYARIFAILPLAILVGSISALDMGRYFNAVSYNAKVVYGYDQTLPVLLRATADKNVEYTVVVSNDQLSFYRLLMLKRDNIKVYGDDGNNQDDNYGDNRRLVVLSSGSQAAVPDDAQLDKVYANWHSRDNLVLKVYK